MAAKTNILKRSLLDALEQSLGIITTACKIVGCNRSTFYGHYSRDKEFRAAVDDIQNITLEGNVTATIFYLKTKGKKRGYIERREVEMTAEISTTKLSDAARKKIDDILNDEY